MLVKIQYTTQLKAAIGFSEEEIQMPDGSTISDVIELLAHKHAEAFRQLVLDTSGQIYPSILLCVNDEQVDAGDSQPIADGSVVTFLSAISGG